MRLYLLPFLLFSFSLFAQTDHYENLVTELDNCIDIFNPDQADIDENEVGDACEDTGVSDIHFNEMRSKLIIITDVLGREVNDDYKGIILLQYADGTTRKMIRSMN